MPKNWYRDFGQKLRERPRHFIMGYVEGVLIDYFESFGLSRKQAEIMAELYVEKIAKPRPIR